MADQKYAILITYNGTGFCGWQKQKGSAASGRPSIQGTIETAIERLSGERVSVVGSGRTDAGVHAVGQVAHFWQRNKVWDEKKLRLALNSVLPPEIQILGVKQVAEEFHAQRTAVRKQYSYYFQQGPTDVPHLRPYSYWIRRRLDLDRMREALAHLIGEHDFLAFQASGAVPGPTVREIFEAEIEWTSGLGFPLGGTRLEDEDSGLIRLRVVGSGFLKQMVRSIAGTLLEVGEARRTPKSVENLILSPKREEIGPTAPGRGLWLEKVWYPGLTW